jgi:hypothetical protein
MEIRNQSKEDDNGKIVGGLILVGVGVALLARNVGVFMPHWLFTWPMILILIGLYIGVKHNFRNNAWIILVAIGGFFLFSKFFPTIRMEPYFWPLLIIGVGLMFILRPRRDNVYQPNVPDEPADWRTVSETAVADPVIAGSSELSDYVRISSVFSGVNRRVLSKDFKGAHVSTVFGGAEINLAQADLKGPVVIKCEIVFGGLKLIVPPHWAVQNEIDGIFHGVEDKRKANAPVELNPAKLIVLKGSVVFGGIEIKSYQY